MQQVLHETGGVYLDTDVVVVRPFGDLWAAELVLGRQSVNGKVSLSLKFWTRHSSCP